MAKERKISGEILLPGAQGWERWSGQGTAPCTRVAEFGQSAGLFGNDGTPRRVLALPSTHIWVLPAWMQGDAAHLRDMARLHLERMGVRIADAEHSLHVARVAEKAGAHLACVLALKESSAAPLWSLNRLPDEVVLHAMCRPLPADSIVIFRELGRLVVAITNGVELVYCSQLSARSLHEQALCELNNICLQLGFQGVLGQVGSIVLWLPDAEGDLLQIQRVTGLAAQRQEPPAPLLPAPGKNSLMLPEVIAERRRRAARGRVRLMALAAGTVIAACIAAMAVLTSLALQERTLLREKVAEVGPRAARVLDQKNSWLEAASAVDPSASPMQVLLHCMEPSAATEISMTHFEWTPDQVVLRGRTPTPSLALQYIREIKGTDGLAGFAWDGPAPVIASDNSAGFEMKGARTP